MSRAILFDIDGTLIDSVDLHARAWQESLAHFGKDVRFEDVRSQIGKGGDQLLPVFLDKAEREKFGEELTEYRGALYKKKYMGQVKPFPMVRELFLALRERGLGLGLASSAKEDELKVYERLARIEDLVNAGTSADDAKRTKPHPDIFAAALKKVGARAQEAVVVGDSPYDAEAAGKLGIRTVGVLCGGFPGEELRRAGCVALYRDPADLLARLDETPLVRAGQPDARDAAP